jgi:hypothetical protein
VIARPFFHLASDAKSPKPLRRNGFERFAISDPLVQFNAV